MLTLDPMTTPRKRKRTIPGFKSSLQSLAVFLGLHQRFTLCLVALRGVSDCCQLTRHEPMAKEESLVREVTIGEEQAAVAASCSGKKMRMGNQSP